jgi:hypothetical protein
MVGGAGLGIRLAEGGVGDVKVHGAIVVSSTRSYDRNLDSCREVREPKKPHPCENQPRKDGPPAGDYSGRRSAEPY